MLNKYAKKKGVAKHRDPSDKWAPLVIGVTLMRRPGDPISAMQFESLPGAPALWDMLSDAFHQLGRANFSYVPRAIAHLDGAENVVLDRVGHFRVLALPDVIDEIERRLP